MDEALGINTFKNSVYKVRVLILAYLTAFFTGYAFPIAGILSPQIAADLGVKTTQIVFVDAFFLVGLTLGSIISGKILDKLGTVRSIVLAVSALLLVNLGLAVQSDLHVYTLFVFVNGTSMGLLIASVNYFIISAFSGNDIPQEVLNDRSAVSFSSLNVNDKGVNRDCIECNVSDSKLNIMQFFVGIGGFIGVLSAGFIVFHSSWRIVFVVAAFFYFIVLLAYKIIKIAHRKKEFIPVDKKRDKKQEKIKTAPAYILMIGLALISYVYVEYIISYWFSPYLQEVKSYNIKSVGGIISIFWLTLAFGRLVLGKYILTKISDYLLIIILSLITVVGFLCFLYSHSIAMIYLSIILLGIGCSAIFPTLLAYGMKLSDHLSTYTLSFLVTCGFFGGMLSLMCSSILGAHLPKLVPILTGPLWCILIVVFLVLAKKFKNKKYSSTDIK